MYQLMKGELSPEKKKSVLWFDPILLYMEPKCTESVSWKADKNISLLAKTDFTTST